MLTIRKAVVVAAAGLALALGATPAEAQLFGRIRDRVRDRVQKKVEETTDRAVDRAVDRAGQTVQNAGRDSASGAKPGAAPASATTAPASPAAASSPSVAAPSASPSPSATSASGTAPVAPPAPPTPSAATRPLAADTPPRASASATRGGDMTPRPARQEALTSPFADGDLAWILPLLDAQAADSRRERAGVLAGANASVAHLQDGPARVEAIRSGRLNAFDVLRAHSPHAKVPPGAVYHAACSAGVTEGVGGIATNAVFVVPRLEAAREFYRANGYEILGDAGLGYVIRAPDRRVSISLANPNGPRAVARATAAQGAPGYDHLRPCADLPDGVVLMLTAEKEMSDAGQAAQAAAAGPAPERLPAALRAAGLSAAEWDRVVAMVWEAATDEMFATQPASLDAAAGSRAEGDRRRANVAWYLRNRGVIDPAVRATGPER